MPYTVAANSNNNAIRFTEPDLNRDEKADFPCVAISTYLQSSRENFGQKTTGGSGSIDVIGITARLYAMKGMKTEVEYNGTKKSGTKLLSVITSEYVNAFKKYETTLESKISRCQIAQVPFVTDANVLLEDDTSKPTKRCIYNELEAFIEVRDVW